jgi:hypothetical protein
MMPSRARAQLPIHVSTALKVTPGNCSAVPSKSIMSPL